MVRLYVYLLALCLPLFSGPVHAQQDLFEDIFSRHPVAMMLIDPADGRIVRANHAAASFYGYDRDQLLAMSIKQINALSPQAIREEMALAKREQRDSFIFKHRLASGELRPVEVFSLPIDYYGQLLLFSTVRDISDRVVNTDALWHYQERLETMVAEKSEQLLEHASDELRYLMIVIAAMVVAIFTLIYLLYQRRKTSQALSDQSRRLSEVIWGTDVGTWEWHIPSGRVAFNERWADIVGYTLDELQPISIETWAALCNEEDLKHSEQLLKRAFTRQSDYYECEARMRHKDGHWVWVLDRGKVVEWDEADNPVRMSGTHQDISRQKQLQADLEYLAHYDTLTGLPNRSLFHERATQALKYARRHHHKVAMLFIDLDGFKAVNDDVSHEAGDQTLKILADRMLSCVRKSDTVARLGGDEFAVVLQSVHSKEDAASVAQKIIDELSAPCVADRKDLVISASIGITCYPEHGVQVDQLLNRADDAMYSAKRAGKGRAVFC